MYKSVENILTENGIILDTVSEDLYNKIVKSMNEHGEQTEDALFNLYNKPLQELKPLQDLWRKENSPDKFVIPDATKFYIWIRNKILK